LVIVLTNTLPACPDAAGISVLVLTQVAVLPDCDCSRYPLGPRGMNDVTPGDTWIGMSPACPPLIFVEFVAQGAALPVKPIDPMLPAKPLLPVKPGTVLALPV
jgi:hypothetical protein